MRTSSVAMCFNPSNGFVCLRTPSQSSFAEFQLRFNPSNGFVCLRTPPGILRKQRAQCFNPSNGFVCLRTEAPDGFVASKLRVSIRRTDLCAFELHTHGGGFRLRRVSIRRTDLCAFEHGTAHESTQNEDGFQSVERICVPSNGAVRVRARAIPHVSIRRTDLCAFEPRLSAWCSRRPHVSIRRTDLCAFELARSTFRRSWRACSFNPSNGFVCLRTPSIPSNRLSRQPSFQSVERICVPSNLLRGIAVASSRRSFNPSNGFVCLRTL